MQAVQEDTASASASPSSSMLNPSILRLRELKMGKADALSLSPNGSSEDSDGSKRSGGGGDSSFPTVKFSPRNASSKYDFVKVKVWLGDNCDHYYVLSRFLLSRMLTVTKAISFLMRSGRRFFISQFPPIVTRFLSVDYHTFCFQIPNHVAIKIALELKKLLIDNSLLDVYALIFHSSQSDLEANLFKLMERRGYGEEYINRYKMMTRFHHQRVPLIILVCGTACVGKSTIATQLAQRLNLPNVLQTDMVYELLRTSTDAPLSSTPVWARDFSSSEELITEFCRESRVVRKGLAGDLKKAMKDGKPIIIEGIHLDPSIYLMDDENKSPSIIPERIKDTNSLPDTSDNSPPTQTENNPNALRSQSENDCCTVQETSVGVQDVQVNKVSNALESIDLDGRVAESTGGSGTAEDPEKDKSTPSRKENAGAQPVIVPIVLKMAEFDHKALLEEWISTRTFCDNGLTQDKDRLISNLKTIQDYLCSFKSQGMTVVNISATTFPQTLDWLHSYLLQVFRQHPVRTVHNRKKNSDGQADHWQEIGVIGYECLYADLKIPIIALI
ncbi:hypothetical protein CDL15_Pgr022859 [Punica granatum]|uniref:2-phosphoglycerate kinase n=1 Tax=Punica granatum TaxID=22663 RepID=A0A218X3A2_PUNGR|nr:hypothetical protein CDL15_Pgr022859 [Punica granatum]